MATQQSWQGSWLEGCLTAEEVCYLVKGHQAGRRWEGRDPGLGGCPSIRILSETQGFPGSQGQVRVPVF